MAALLCAAATRSIDRMYRRPWRPRHTAVPGRHSGNARNPTVMSMNASLNFCRTCRCYISRSCKRVVNLERRLVLPPHGHIERAANGRLGCM